MSFDISVPYNRFSAILDKMRSARVAVLGDLMLDVYVSGSSSRISQEAPVPVLRVRKSETRLGGAANVMRNLTSLQAGQVFAFGIVGKDADGEKLCKLLRQGGVNTDGVLAVDDRRTTVKQRVIAGNQQVVRMDFEDTDPVSDDVRLQLAENLCAMIRARAFDAVILEDYAKGLLEKDMLQKITDTANEYGIYTSLDPHPGHNMQVRGLSLMTPNRSEAFGLSGIYCSDPADVVEEDEGLKKTAAAVIDSWSPKSLLITLGHQGMALFRKDQPGSVFVIPTVAKEVFDVSGAGDTVISTYTLCCAAGATEEEASVISNHAAGIVVGKAGTAVTDPAEMRAMYPRSNGGNSREKRSLILASASPRRKELLKEITDQEFSIIPSNAEEGTDPVANAQNKAQDIAAQHPEAVVIGADTVVVTEDGTILGKPAGETEALDMLMSLSGKTHKVITGICVMCQETSYLARFAVKSDVEFRTFDESIAREYIRLVPVLDKAGAYAIQEHGDMIIANICGSYNNIVGLPTERLKEILNSAVNAD